MATRDYGKLAIHGSRERTTWIRSANRQLYYKQKNVDEGGGIVPVGVVYEIYQHKISRTEFIPVQQNLLNMKQGG